MRPIPKWKRYFYETIAAEISSFTRYYERVVQWRPVAADTLTLLSLVEAGSRDVVAGDELPVVDEDPATRTAVLLNGAFNYEHDITGRLRTLKRSLNSQSRVVVVVYNAYLRWLYALATRVRLRAHTADEGFITFAALRNIAAVSGFEIVRIRPAVLVPWRLLGLGKLINMLAALPVLRLSSIVSIVVLRPKIALQKRPSLSVIIPARNEKGNIEAAIQRLPDLDTRTEIIFVEGHSSDGTWSEINRVATAYRETHHIRCFQQTGRGKADAVRLGFSEATGDLLTILDADLTMPPELLGQFYDAYLEGVGEFINGNRLVYPMEGEAMRRLNHLGNLFFAKTLGWVMNQPVGDALCGTKLLSRADYARITRWRERFGDFDPFGDFELLFGAASLALKIVDVPIRYRARTYGTTNIRRFRDGLRLLNMTVVGFVKMKLGRTPGRPT